jgi:hypothetical protein
MVWSFRLTPEHGSSSVTYIKRYGRHPEISRPRKDNPFSIFHGFPVNWGPGAVSGRGLFLIRHVLDSHRGSAA